MEANSIILCSLIQLDKKRTGIGTCFALFIISHGGRVINNRQYDPTQVSMAKRLALRAANEERPERELPELILNIFRKD